MKNFLKFKTQEPTTDPRKFGEEFYLREARLWRPFRLFGVCATVAALLFISTGIANGRWVVIRGHPVGIWDSCYNNVSATATIAAGSNTEPATCEDKKPYWQNAVLGLMMFAASFGALAAVLSICGVLTTPLPKKIYYYHSAGEIFLICALSTTVALIIFPVAIEHDLKLLSHHYGTGYGLGWGGTIFFFAAALCMSLDDIVRESSTSICCTLCMGSSNQNQCRRGGGGRGHPLGHHQTELQQV
ncbi:endoglucanase 4-like isoform X2 [Octopus vulgaris]|uniref:Endoglucanase 4-like isoform X2 n=2 Tax=Octopus TaxID=6643 RepID=A0AA36B5Y1_OCTVU|nr:uncharacterized protein LOC115216470 [Octopus sinensis]CAI9728508.1 endoglucanase 4-like isoform X2 [Octopus vulgaris]